MRTMMLITILVLMTTMMAKSEETTTLTDIKDEVVKQTTMLQNHLSNEWIEIKEFQKTSWEQGKEQNAANWAKIKSFFTNLTGQNNASQN